MKVFYESYPNFLIEEQVDVLTIDNILELEESIGTLSNIHIQAQDKIKQVFNNSTSDITILDVIKTSKSSKFASYRLTLEYNIPYLIKIEVDNVRVDGADFNIYLNNQLIETISYTDYYKQQNDKSVKIFSDKLQTNILLTLPKYFYNKNYVEYSLKLYEPGKDYDYDSFRNNIIFNVFTNKVSYICMHKGHILRARTINSVLFKDKSFLKVEEASNYIELLQPLIFPNGKTIYYIQPQTLNILMNSLQVGYNYIGVYVDFSDLKLKYKILDSDVNYNTLVNRIKLAVADDVYQQIFFGIALNNTTRLNWIDLIYLSAGGGTGAGGVNKLIVDFTNVDSITINYTGGNQPPIVQIYDDSGNVIVPQNIHYDYANNVIIDFGQVLSGKVVLI